MPMNVSRWVKYAKAMLNETVKSSNAELDRLEARREAEAADKPWLRAEGDAPTLDEAKARIAWEAENQAEVKAEAEADAKAAAGAARTTSSKADDDGGNDAANRGPVGKGRDWRAQPDVTGLEPVDAADAAARSTAQIELDQRAKDSADRLEQIRRELGVDDPPSPPPPATKA